MLSRRSNLTSQVLIGAVLIALVALTGRLIYIQSYEGTRLLSRAARQQQSVVPLRHRRGLIVDSNGRIIAGTLLRKSVFADPTVIPEKREAALAVERILGVASAEILSDLIADDRRFFLIRRGVTDEQARLIGEAGIYGLGVFDEPYRTYPMSTVASALVGFVSPDGVGVSGIEHQCESWLRGQDGVKTIVRDAGRNAFWLAEGGYRPPRDGYHVVLTIDAEIQANAERALAECLKTFSAESAVAVVIHPSTGAILAMANAPVFDLNNYRDASPTLYRNRAITDPYEPGSTFKPFIAAAALSDDAVRLTEVFDCEHGAWQDGARVLHDHHPYGLLRFDEVIIKSSNIGMAKLGKRLGNRRLYDCVKSFGFGGPTDVDLEGEGAGIVPPYVRWGPFTTTSIPIGQEIAVTPLQLARAFCTFANGGFLVQPHVIRAVMTSDGRVVSDFSNPPDEGRVISQEVADVMRRDLLCRVVEQGTGTKSRLDGYYVFGKSGTAQIARRDGRGYKKDAYVSSFIAGAPVRDPQLVVLVSVTRPKKSLGYYGGTVAAPVVRQILGHGLAYLQVPPDRPRGSLTAALADQPHD